MNKQIDTNERVFMSVVGPSGSGKSNFILEMLESRIFVPAYDKIFFFYLFYQKNLEKLEKRPEVELINSTDFSFVFDLPQDGTKYLLIFDDSCEEIMANKNFNKLTTAGRHKNLNTILVKHNLFHKGKHGRDAELQLTHIVLFKSPRDVQQINYLSRQLGYGQNLVEWYKDATTEAYGFLMIDLSSKTIEPLRFSTGFNPTKFYSPNNETRKLAATDKYTEEFLNLAYYSL